MTIGELSPDDFQIVNTLKGKLIQLESIKDISIVLFFKSDCEISNQIKKMLTLIDETDIECNIYYFDSDKYKGYIKSTFYTKTPIYELPYLVIFANKRPYMSYSGNFNIIDITKLITYVQLLQTVTASIKMVENSVVPVYYIKDNES